ncbi:MAG: Ig-like domain-containing protein [Kofleriaceae bacterium]
MNAPDNRDGFAGGGASLEQVTFCKTQGPNDGAAGAGDSQRPDEVILSDESALELCPTDPTKPVSELTNALPEAWYARIQFDELLDPSIEDLIPDVDAMGVPTGTYTGTLVNTQPVTLKCASVTGSGMVDVPYDGYYSPAGNKISYPVGPSLVIIPTDPTVVATGSECTVTIKSNVTDKDGNQVPADQIGPYKFAVGAIEVLIIDPTDGGKQDPIAAGVDLTFNTAVVKASVASAIDFSPVLLNAGIQKETPEEYFAFADFPSAGGPYTFTLKQGSMLIDQCGKATTLGAPSVASFTKTTFTTNALKLKAVTGAIEPGNMIQIAFNQYMDPATLLTAEYTITPTLAGARVELSGDTSKLLVYGNFQLGTAYTFTLTTGATIDDCPGDESATIGGPGCVTSATFTASADQTTTFTTAAAITLKSIAPKDNATESVATATSSGILLTFNQEIDPTSFDAADYTISPAETLTATNLGGPGGGGSYEMLELDPAVAWAPGTYTFTLKSTAVLKDLLGNSFSPTADQVIHFTVTPNATATPHTCL